MGVLEREQGWWEERETVIANPLPQQNKNCGGGVGGREGNRHACRKNFKVVMVMGLLLSLS